MVGALEQSIPQLVPIEQERQRERKGKTEKRQRSLSFRFALVVRGYYFPENRKQTPLIIPIASRSERRSDAIASFFQITEKFALSTSRPSINNRPRSARGNNLEGKEPEARRALSREFSQRNDDE